MTENEMKNEPKSGISPDKMHDFWTDVMKLPTIGPLYAFSKDFGAHANDYINLGKIMAELKTQNDSYWALLSAAFAKATQETTERAPKQLVSKEDFENYRRGMIEAFEDAFTGLFASPEFSVVYGKVFSAQLDFSKALQSIAEKNLKILNMPTRAEIDEILKDINALRKSVRELKKEIEVLKNDQARSIAT
ncbi:MAG: poly(R)-hydroxyalkanoic acid synthase subunit PhaE [Nitrososphaera sp.]